MDKEQRTTEFAVFCIENTAARVQMKGTDIFRELMRSNGIEQFVYPSYATLHTQSKEYIVNEVLDYITRHNPHFLKTNTKIA